MIVIEKDYYQFVSYNPYKISLALVSAEIKIERFSGKNTAVSLLYAIAIHWVFPALYAGLSILWKQIEWKDATASVSQPKFSRACSRQDPTTTFLC